MNKIIQDLIHATKGYHSIEDCKTEERFETCKLCQAIVRAERAISNTIEYKGYLIGLSESLPRHLLSCILDGDKIVDWSGYFDSDEKAIQAAKRAIDKMGAKPNPYTPSNRPPYPWVRVDDELPEPYPHRFLGVFISKIGSRFIAKSYFDGDTFYFMDDNIKAYDYGYRLTHWQYMPALPE